MEQFQDFVSKGWVNDREWIASVDEVGRGPLAGPVVASCLFLKLKQPGLKNLVHMLTSYFENRGIKDSKELSFSQREKVLQDYKKDSQTIKCNKVYLLDDCSWGEFWFCISEVDAETIDQVNILKASQLAMKMSFLKVYQQVWQESEISKKGELHIDGHLELKLGQKNIFERCLIKGDSISPMIGLASIFAKQFRDKKMMDYDLQYPGYGFEKNAGYPTQGHRKAIEELGITQIHRKTFKGVKEYVQN